MGFTQVEEIEDMDLMPQGVDRRRGRVLKLVAHEEMTDGSHIRTPQFHRLCDRCFQLGVAELAAHTEERNHGSRSTLASMFLVHQLPELVIAFGPAALGSPLRQPLLTTPPPTELSRADHRVIFWLHSIH